MKNNQGFTLIELIIVVAIMGILSSVAYFSFSNHYNMLNLTATVDKMGTEMNWAKNYATVREKDCVVKIYPSNGEYQFFVKDVAGHEETFGPPGEILTESKVSIGNNIQIDMVGCADDDPCILTYDYLTEVWDLDVEIILSLSGQPSQTLGIDGVTGRVYVE